MRNSTKFISMFMVVLSILVFAVQRRGICSPASPDSCDLKTYVFYTDTIVEDAFTNGPANLARLGNFFPIADYTSGVIKSLDM